MIFFTLPRWVTELISSKVTEAFWFDRDELTEAPRLIRYLELYTTDLVNRELASVFIKNGLPMENGDVQLAEEDLIEVWWDYGHILTEYFASPENTMELAISRAIIDDTQIPFEDWSYYLKENLDIIVKSVTDDIVSVLGPRVKLPKEFEEKKFGDCTRVSLSHGYVLFY